MSSVQLTGKMNLMSFLSMQTILCSIAGAVKEIRERAKAQGKASDFGSTRNVLHRTDMTYMIRVLRAADWEQHANSGIKK